MKISKTKSCKYWKQLKSEIISDFDNEDLWTEAIKLFEERIKYRYLKPISKIEKGKNHEGEGYAIMTIYCSLIEFLETINQGINFKLENPDKSKFEYSVRKSKKIYISFLTNRFGFKISQSLAKQFYVNVRCGLLHEAKLGSNWLIRVDSAKLIGDVDGNIVLNRKLFSERIKKYLKKYTTQLVKDEELKKAFIRKYDYLCE